MGKLIQIMGKSKFKLKWEEKREKWKNWEKLFRRKKIVSSGKHIFPYIKHFFLMENDFFMENDILFQEWLY